MKMIHHTFGNLVISSGVFFLTFAYSCSSEKSDAENTKAAAPKEAVFEKILEKDSAVFSGVHLDLNPAQIKDYRKVSPDDVDSAYLLYDVRFNDSMNYTVEYEFDENQLCKAITLDIYLQDRKDADQELEKFKSFLTKKYGEPVLERDILSWGFKLKTGEQYFIELQDESFHYNYGKLTVTLGKQKDKDFPASV